MSHCTCIDPESQCAFCELEAKVERLEQERDSMRERFLNWRGLEPDDACSTCDGAGVRSYPNTTTWRGGYGGQSITSDVCDKCWGSGNKNRPWPSRRSGNLDPVWSVLSKAGISHGGTVEGLEQGLSVVEKMRDELKRIQSLPELPWAEVSASITQRLASLARAGDQKSAQQLLAVLDKGKTYVGRLKAERDQAVRALENVRLYALKHRKLALEEFNIVLRFVSEGGVTGSVLREEP